MTQNIQSIPPFQPETLIEPYDYLKQLRAIAPIHYSNELNGWILTKHQDVAEAFRHPHFISDNFETQVRNQLQGHDIAIAHDFIRVRTKMMLHNDGQTHHRLRKTCNVSFGKKGLLALTPVIEQAVSHHVNALPENGTWDFATDFAEPLSTRVIADLFNVPYEDRVHFQKCSDDVSRFFGNAVSDTEECAKVANQGVLELEAYFIEYFAERQRNPGNDLLSLLIKANSDGLLTEEEVIAQCVLVMMAGHFTVIDQLCNSINTFLTEGIWPALVKEPSLISPAIEESIRFDGSVLFMARTVSEDTEFNGVLFSKDDTVFLGMGAANRDPDVFEQPDTFSIYREKTRHLGFGYGPHQCIGLGLGRIEMGEAIKRLAQKFPRLILSPNHTLDRKCESLFFRGFYSLPVTQACTS